MPNWCYNTLTLKSANPELIKRVIGGDEENFFEKFFPCPQELSDTVEGFTSDEVESKKLEAQRKANIEKYGHASWYSWCVENWGTKWDFSYDISEADEDYVTITFDSAWSPPVAGMRKLEELGFEVELFFNEEGMAYCGEYTTEDGLYDYEYGDLTADEIDEQIPQELNDMFNIAQNKRDWEEENAEEEDEE